jgi:hypothetical protein
MQEKNAHSTARSLYHESVTRSNQELFLATDNTELIRPGEGGATAEASINSLN